MVNAMHFFFQVEQFNRLFCFKNFCHYFTSNLQLLLNAYLIDILNEKFPKWMTIIGWGNSNKYLHYSYSYIFSLVLVPGNWIRFLSQ